MKYTRLMTILRKAIGRMLARAFHETSSGAPSLPAGTEPLISSHNPPYLSAISIKGSVQPFEVLGTVHDFLEGEVHTDIGSLISTEAISQFLERDNYPLPATIDRENVITTGGCQA
jgi:hypothetical protein